MPYFIVTSNRFPDRFCPCRVFRALEIVVLDEESWTDGFSQPRGRPCADAGAILESNKISKKKSTKSFIYIYEFTIKLLILLIKMNEETILVEF